MLDAEGLSASEHDRKVGVPMAVAIGHAATVEAHRAVEERTVRVLNIGESIEKVTELLNIKGVAGGEVLHHSRIAVVMGQSVAGADAELWDGRAAIFDTRGEGGDAGLVSLEREDDDVVHRPEILTKLR